MPLAVDEEKPESQWEAVAEAVAAGVEPVVGRGPDPGPDPDPEPPTKRNALGFDSDEIEKLLESLMPEAGEPVRWKDLRGGTYEHPLDLPASSEFRLGKFAKVVFRLVLDGYTRAGAGGKVTGAHVLLGLLDVLDEPLLAEMDRTFAGVFPDQLAAARAAAGRADANPSDLFRTAEMLKAFGPFCAGLIVEVIRLVSGLPTSP